MKKYKRVDLSKIKTYPLAKRRNKVSLKDFASKLHKDNSFDDFMNALPNILAVRDFKHIVKAITNARGKEKPVILAIGAHLIKCGLSPIIIDLIKRGIITAIACNAAVSVHDYEVSLIGETSEDVGAALHKGTFGMAEETGRDINIAIRKGVEKGLGYGESVGREIIEKKNPYRQYSIFAICVENGVPITVHDAIGTVVLHQHPSMNGAVTGKAFLRDFRLLIDMVSDLGDGGVWLNVGSAVILPEVFLKAFSVAQNLGHAIENFTTANFDMIQHYRPNRNVVKRPTKGIGQGFSITGHHEIMIPLLAQALIDEIDKER